MSETPDEQPSPSADPAPAAVEPAPDDDPLRAMRESLGLPEREGGTPITANLDQTLRRGGIALILVGTGCLALWRILTWLA